MEDISLDQAPVSDAAMMEANMNAEIDELFGGGSADLVAADGLDLAMQPIPLPAKLVSRIAELQWKGCCTKLVWSSVGYIAHIPDEGRRIAIQTTLRSPKTGGWELTGESKHVIEAPEDVLFKHIESSALGTELAAVDSHGRVLLYSSQHQPMGKMSQAHVQHDDSKNLGSDLDAVVGMHWLAMYPTEFKIPHITSARKVGEKWTAHMRHRDANEPAVHHAAEARNALLYVSRDTNLTLMYQGEGTWHTLSTRLENLASFSEMLTHASLGEDGDHLLLVTHDLNKRLKLYKISIAWNPHQQTRTGGSQYTAVAPSLDVGHLTLVDNIAAQHADAAKLSTLKIIPAVPKHVEYGTPTAPTVVAIFTRASSSTDPTQPPQDSFSVVSRWHLEMVTPTLHDSFLKLKKSNSITPTQAAVTVLRRQEDIITNKVVTSVTGQSANTILCFPASDGTLEYHDRATMTSIEAFGESDVASSLQQSGFEHPMTDYTVHTAMSADGSGMVYQQTDGKLAVKSMALRYSWLSLDDGMSDTTGLIEAAIVSLARQYAVLSVSQLANEESIALLPRHLSSELRIMYVREVVKFTNRPLDISVQDPRNQAMAAIREGFLHRAVSAQLMLNTKLSTGERNVLGKFAHCLLHLRACAQLLAQMLSQVGQFIRPDVLHSMRGAMRWASEVVVYVARSLVDLKTKLADNAENNTDPSSMKAAIQKHLVDDDENPTAHLLLNAFTRAFLKFLAQNLPKYLTAIQRVLPNATSVQQRQQLQETYDHSTSPHLPFRYGDFEAMMHSVDGAIRQAYAASGLPSDRRTEVELQTMCDPALPDELSAPLVTLMDTALPTFMAMVDQSKLAFWDTTWLGIESAADMQGLDIIRKLPLSRDGEVKLRVCRRCGAKMEDVDLRRSPQWLMGAQRTCVCGSGWWLSD